VAQRAEFILTIRKEMLGRTSVSPMNTTQDCHGNDTQSHKRDRNTVLRRNSSVSSIRVCRGVASANHRACSKFSPGFTPL
jgi:hypothetical protein